MNGHHLELVKIKTLRVITVNCHLSKLNLGPVHMRVGYRGCLGCLR